MKTCITLLISISLLSGCAFIDRTDKKMIATIMGMDERLKMECRAGILAGYNVLTSDAEVKMLLMAMDGLVVKDEAYKKCYLSGLVLKTSGEMAEDGIRKFVENLIRIGGAL